MVYGFHNRKGGVGKTSLSTNCAVLSDYNTCLIDADPQGNATSYLMPDPPEFDLSDVLNRRCGIEDALYSVHGITILPTRADSDLKKFERELTEEPYAFVDLNEVIQGIGFEIIIYDLSPGLSTLERCVLLSCDEVVTPVLAEAFSIDGLERADAEIQRINRSFRREVQNRKLVLNMLNRSFRRHLSALEGYQNLDFDLYTVGQDAKIAEAQFRHLPLSDYDPGSKVLPELRRLTAAMRG